MPAKDRRIYSSDEHPVPQSAAKHAEKVVATESLSTTKKLMNRANDNRVFISLWIGIAAVIGTQMLDARDSTRQQPLIDAHQDFRIDQNAAMLKSMDLKLDALLERKR